MRPAPVRRRRNHARPPRRRCARGAPAALLCAVAAVCLPASAPGQSLGDAMPLMAWDYAEMKVMDALSDVEYGKLGITDIPVPMVSAAQAYIDAKIPH